MRHAWGPASDLRASKITTTSVLVLHDAAAEAAAIMVEMISGETISEEANPAEEIPVEQILVEVT